MNWLQSVMVGFVSGLCEPMPISAEAHRGLLCHFWGLSAVQPLLLLACHGAVLIVLLSAGRLEIRRLRNTARLLRTPQRRRSSHASLNQEGTLRLLRTAALPVIIGRLLSYRLDFVTDRLWLLALPLVAMGFLLWLPTQMRTANKDGRHLSPADGLLLALAALSAAIPGISLVGAVMSVASMRGTQRQYALRFSWLLLTMNLAAGMVMDVLLVLRTGTAFALPELFQAGICGVAAAIGSWLSIHLIRSRTQPGRGGVSGFCFYNWGMALLCLVLFLLV